MFGHAIDRQGAKLKTLEFKVTSMAHSMEMLQALQLYFGCGAIQIDNRRDSTFKYTVRVRDEQVNKVLPHFEAYPLQGSKWLNYQTFKEILFKMQAGVHSTAAGKASVIALADSMNTKRSYEDKFSYCSNKDYNITDPWLSGFIDAEALFYYYIGSPMQRGRPVFSVLPSEGEIKQSSHDVGLLNAIRLLVGGYLKPVFDITNLEAAKASRPQSVLIIRTVDLLITMVEQTPLVTRKHLDHQDFLELRRLHKEKAYLTPQGLAQRQGKKSGMNSKRPK